MTISPIDLDAKREQYTDYLEDAEKNRRAVRLTAIAAEVGEGRRSEPFYCGVLDRMERANIGLAVSLQQQYCAAG